MQINWKVRIGNPLFWIAIVSVFLASTGVSPEMFTTWGTVLNHIKDVFANPFLLLTAVIAILGIIKDPTTPGIGDSPRAMTYTVPFASSAESTMGDMLPEDEGQALMDADMEEAAAIKAEIEAGGGEEEPLGSEEAEG